VSKTEAKGLDISKLTAAPFATLSVVHPVTGEPTGIEIDLHGMDSDVYRAHERKVANRRLSRAAKRGGAKIALTLSAESIEAESLDALVVCTKGWRGLLEAGAEVECTPENARRIYGDGRYRWLRDQVNAFVGDREGFFGA
jgi:hypothetical protein